MKSLLIAVAVLGLSLVASVAEAHHGGFVRSNNVFVGRSVPVRNNNFFFQQTNRGPFGRVRSQTTIFGR